MRNRTKLSGSRSETESFFQANSNASAKMANRFGSKHRTTPENDKASAFMDLLSSTSFLFEYEYEVSNGKARYVTQLIGASACF